MKFSRTLVPVIALVLGAGSASQAQTTWNDVATNWNSNPSWSAGAPTGATVANLPSDAAIGFQPTLTANGSALGLTVDNGGNDYTIGGAGFVLDIGASGIVSTGAGNLTIQPTLNLSANQSWNASTTSGNILRVTGNLTGSSVLTIANATASNTNTLPNIRFSGNNSGFTGNLSLGGGTFGILLEGPQAMTGGLIDISSGNTNLWLSSNNSTNPYVFGTGNSAGSPNVNFRNAGSGGLYLTGGDVYWDPGNGSDYTWAAGTNSQIRVSGTNDTVRRMLFIGNSSSNLTLTGSRALTNGGAGNFSGYATLQSALVDNTSGVLNFDSSLTLTILTRNAVNDASPGNTTVSGGALSVSTMNQIFDGYLNLSGGVLVLNNMTWSDFAADRSGEYRASNGTNSSWGIAGGGFAARGSDLNILINATATAAYGTITANAVFNRNFTLGSGAVNADGTFYAGNAVNVQQDTVLTTNRTITIANNGGLFGTGLIVRNEFSGNLTGAGAISVTGPANSASAGVLVLSSKNNSWTGNISSSQNGGFFNSGAGGMLVNQAFVRFVGDASLPTGNGGTPALLGAIQRNGSSPFGFLLTGNGTTEEIYDLPSNYRFMIGGMGTQENAGTLGAEGGWATLRNASVLIHVGSNASASQNLTLLARDNTLLQLGASGSGNDVRFIASAGQDGAGSTTATTAADSSGNRVLIKRGTGTVSLANVTYTNVAESTSNTSQFTWLIGRGGTDNTIANPFFDGAVRETGSATSNSLAGLHFVLQGGVLESSDTALGASFTRGLGTGSTQFRWAQGGGGFASSGGNLTVNIGATPDTTEWNDTNFVSNNNALIFGSSSANGTVDFQNTIGLANAVNTTANREIRVIDNPDSANDRVVFSGNIHNRGNGTAGGTGTRNLTKTGNGTLVLAGSNNTYNGDTVVAAGTLVVNGVLTANVTTNPVISVSAGATLGGNGTINRAVNVSGTLSPGNSPGILNTGNLTLAGNSTFVLELNGTTPGNGASNHDQVNVTGGVTFGNLSSDRITLSLSLGYTAALNDVFVVINNDGADAVAFGGAGNGLFRYAGNDLVDGGNFSFGAYSFTIDYTYNGGGDGNLNDVALIVTAVPEPNIALMMLGGFGMLALFRRRS